jgi:hypothetical protein
MMKPRDETPKLVDLGITKTQFGRSSARDAAEMARRAFTRSTRFSEAWFQALTYAVQAMAPAGFAVRRSLLPVPILPRDQSACHHDRRPEGRKQSDHHRDHRGKGLAILHFS